MSDERLRDLERRWKETGDLQHGAALLRERVRIGDLKEERLRLAARLGDPAAVQATSVAASRSLAEAVEHVLAHEAALGVRALHVLAEIVLPAWESWFGPSTGMEVIAKAIRSQVRAPELEINWPGLALWALERRLWAMSLEPPLPPAVVASAEVIARCAELQVGRPALATRAPPILKALERDLVLAVDPANTSARLVAELVPLLVEGRDPLTERPPDLSQDGFWALIAEAGQGEDRTKRLTDRLVERSFNELIDFGLHFNACWYRAYRYDLWDAAHLIEGGCSDDMFMDFRAGLTGLGRAVFEAALADPDSLADLGDLYVPDDGPGFALRQALRRKCGGDESALLPDLLQHWHLERSDPKGTRVPVATRFPRLWKLHGDDADVE